MGSKTKKISTSVVRFQRRLEEWRHNRRKGERRIPKALWSEGVRLAFKTSPYVVSRAAGLDYAALKRRMAAATEGARAVVGIGSGFVEITAPVSSDSWTGSVLELSDERGRMVLRICSGVEVNAAALVAAFRDRAA